MSYKVKYNFQCEFGNFSKQEVKDYGGGTDAWIFVSMLYPEDGSLSLGIVSKDGRNPEKEGLDSIEIFKAWILLASELAKDNELDLFRQNFAKQVFESFREIIK